MTTKTKLVLTPHEMVNFEHNYPLTYDGAFVATNDQYSPLSNYSPLFALDCEMCVVEGGKYEATEVSVVDENENVIYSTLIKPDKKIIDYKTEFNGITRETLMWVTTRQRDVQQVIRQLIPSNAIICGHSLDKDFCSLGMSHPYVIDTSYIYNVSGRCAHKPKLKVLSEMFLGQRIQTNLSGHHATEDALAVMRLVKLKLREGVKFGNACF